MQEVHYRLGVAGQTLSAQTVVLANWTKVETKRSAFGKNSLLEGKRVGDRSLVE
jgi:hypothetical protein